MSRCLKLCLSCCSSAVFTGILLRAVFQTGCEDCVRDPIMLHIVIFCAAFAAFVPVIISIMTPRCAEIMLYRKLNLVILINDLLSDYIRLKV